MNRSLLTIIFWTIIWAFITVWIFFWDYYLTKKNILSLEAPDIANYNWFQIFKIKQEDIKPIALAANISKIDFNKIFFYQWIFFNIPKLNCSINIWTWDIKRNYILNLSTYELDKKQKEALQKRLIKKNKK